LALLFAMPVQAQETSSQPSGAISVDDSAAQDAAIATRIRSILEELNGYGDVTVTVSNGIVTLRGTTLDTAKAAALNDLVGRVEAVVAIENNVVETTDVVKRLNPAVDRFKERINQTIAYLPLALVALTAFFVVIFLGLFVARLKEPWDRLAPNAFIAEIYRTLLPLISLARRPFYRPFWGLLGSLVWPSVLRCATPLKTLSPQSCCLFANHSGQMIQSKSVAIRAKSFA
jgi:small conductance mechanosensitive channel